jgi:glucose-6-phosphate 1-epimerase
MDDKIFDQLKKQFEIPDRVTLTMDQDGLIKAIVQSDQSTAEIYLKGAHVTSFEKKGEKLLLFMSPSAKMPRGEMLHGGIPLCFPWFGNREGETLSHGFARNSFWDLVATNVKPNGIVELSFRLPPETLNQAGWAPVEVFYRVSIGEKLQLELLVNNTTTLPFSYEECFHAYFLVGDIHQVTVRGLKGLTYLDKNLFSKSTEAVNNYVTPVLAPSSMSDKLSCCAPSTPCSSSPSAILKTDSKNEDFAVKQESSDDLRIIGETNSVYLNSTAPVEIHDSSLHRVIHIEKENSRSTVVWNPGSEKAKSIVDFVPEDYRHMLCVESGNVKEATIRLAPGESSRMKVQLSCLKYPC